MNVDLKLYSTNKMEGFKWTNVMIVETTIQVEATPQSHQNKWDGKVSKCNLAM